jgi:isopenicillin N synthase-like dioxygenase
MQFVEVEENSSDAASASPAAAYTFYECAMGEEDTRRAIATRLRDHGFIVVRLEGEGEGVSLAMREWEDTFREAFERLPAADTAGATDVAAGAAAATTATAEEGGGPSPYRVERGATLGYRRDDTRQFFETRRAFDNTVDPTSSVLGYSACALELFRLLGAVGRVAAGCMAELLQLGPDYFTDLMDAADIPEAEHFSSSVLRICSYLPGRERSASAAAASDTSAGASKPDIAFGSHTDTSFVTVAPVSSNNGLEIMDLWDGTWHMPEAGEGTNSVVVFTGECCQMLSRSYFRAAVHRVRVMGASSRVSCPLIMRGRKKAEIKALEESVLASISEEHRAYVPDLDGTSMALIHKMLDFKRVKCRKSNEDTEDDDWILAAYPRVIGPLPAKPT